MERRTERVDYGRGGWADIQYAGEQLDGLWTVYHRNGIKRWEREYVAGSQNGYARTWDKAGRLIDEKWFLDGKLHGAWRIWDSSGVLRQLSTFCQESA
jgi:antitoxin component YwqK of YwqJK toxin-antitoxin module